MNRNGELFIRRNPGIKVKLVDGSSLVVAVVLNNIPRGTTQVVFRGNFNKVASYLALALCQRGIQVILPSSLWVSSLKNSTQFEVFLAREERT